jgi:hypothetical protein
VKSGCLPEDNVHLSRDSRRRFPSTKPAPGGCAAGVPSRAWRSNRRS